MLICIDDVESIIASELATSSTAKTTLIGVPPSRGRGGNQTPRSESIYITNSQPLPSPSSSYGSSPMLDKLGFAMSKIDDGEGGKGENGEDTGSREKRGDSMEQAAEAIGAVSLDSTESRPRPTKPGPGPSLLTQQAPPHASEVQNGGPDTVRNGARSADDGGSAADAVPLSTSAMSVDAVSGTADSGSSESGLHDMIGSERITIKIADLGNGEQSSDILL